MFMKKVLVASAALNQTPMAWVDNAANIIQAIDEARKIGVKVLCLPELCITGYGCEDAFYSSSLLAKASEMLLSLSEKTAGICVAFGLPICFQDALYNCAALVADREILGLVPKRNLADEGVYYEPRWFKPGRAGLIASVSIGNREVPFGDLIFDLSGVKVGFEICEDAWVRSRVAEGLADRGCDIVLNPSASHFALGKRDKRRELVREGSLLVPGAYIYANLLGCESGRIIYDGDTLVAQNGKLISVGPRLSYRSVVVSGAEVEFDCCKKSCADAIHSEFDTTSSVEIAANNQASWESSENLKEEEFTRAVSLGLFDYLRKSRHSGFVVSLSGGVDSSAASALVAIMIRGALSEIGLEGFNQKFSYLPPFESSKSITEKLLTCVYQKTENSSTTTQNAAREVAKELRAEYHEFEIDSLIRGYLELISKTLDRRLSWETDDAALQNIQARVRSPGVWLIANLKRALLLSTSNRSEAAVGYTTMDGDTSGGLSPLGGIDKAFLRRWCCWLETKGPAGLGPISAFKLVNQQEPTAELRRLSDNQTDERDLMPYDILERIERLAIRDRCSPQEVLNLVSKEFSLARGDLCRYVSKFFRLWSASQWKRERYAPSFHLDDESLDPKSWCRFPILSGGYAEELETLA